MVEMANRQAITPQLRHDLNGARLYTPGRPEIWLIFEGRRCLIPNEATYDRLFASRENLTPTENVDDIARGDDLNVESRLLQGEGDDRVYFVTGSSTLKIRKHHVVSYQTLLDFGFGVDKVVKIPAIAMRAIPEGMQLRGGADVSALDFAPP